MEQNSPSFKEVSSKLSNSGLVVSIVFLVATFTSTIYLFLQNRQLIKQVSDLQAASKTSNNPIVSVTPTAGVVEVASSSTKTFLDKESGISFQYPSDGKISSREPGPFPVVVQVDNLHPRTGGGGGPEFEGWVVYISEMQPNPKNISLRQWAKENNLFLNPVDSVEVEGKETSPVNTKISGLEAIMWTVAGGDASNNLYLIKHSSGVTLIVVHDNFGEDVTAINKILSSITFKDINIPQITPVTKFTCPENGWVNCMPSIGTNNTDECSSEAMSWYKQNCSNFQGGAM